MRHDAVMIHSSRLASVLWARGAASRICVVGCSAAGQWKLELKQLAAMALLPDREVRPLLMCMMQAGLVMLQEVPRTGDHNPRSTTYLWCVDLDRACAALEREMLLTIGRLHERLGDEERLAAARRL